MCGSSPPPPDYRPMQQASDRAAQLGYDQGMAQLDFAQRQYDENAPFMREIAQQQADIAQRTSDQGAAYFNHWQDNFQGLERDMVADAREYDTAATRNRMATQAAADAGLAFRNNQQANERAQRSMGVNPNSGRAQQMNRQSGLALAAQRAGAMNNTRVQAENLGYARKLDASGLGRNMPGASAGAYGVATGAGSAAIGSQGMAGQQMMQGMGQAGGLMMQGANAQISGLGNVLNSQTSLYAQGMSNQSAMMGGILGAASSFSDRRLKENIVKVGEKGTINIYEFNFKGDETRYQGVMADEVKAVMPHAVSTDSLTGYLKVDYSLIGLEMKEVA